MSTHTIADYSVTRQPALRTIALQLTTTLSALKVWNLRANSRSALSKLDQHLLDDIGMSAKEARIEASKPFWKE